MPADHEALRLTKERRQIAAREGRLEAEGADQQDYRHRDTGDDRGDEDDVRDEATHRVRLS